MQALSRSNYRSRLKSGHLEMEPFISLREIAIPPSSEILTIHALGLTRKKTN